MKSLVSLIFVFSFSAPAKVLVPEPTVDDHEYRALLKTRPDDISPSQRLLQLRPSHSRREQLLGALAKAQQAYVSQSADEARRRFLAVVDLLDKDDWGAGDRAVFLYAYLRLAQLEPNASAWLDRAAVLGTDVAIERPLFPPPLLADLEARRSRLSRVVIDDEIFRSWTTILINGRVCTRNVCQIENDDGRIRVTWLSDKWMPHTALIRMREVTSYRPPRKAWLEGTCAHPAFSGQAEVLGDVEPFFGFGCVAAPVSLAGAALTHELSLPKTPEPAASLYKSKWLWLGLGAIVTAAVIADQNKKKEDREPTTTYGY